MILLLYIVMNTTTSDHSVSEVVKELVRDISALIRSEVTMAKSELQDSMARLGTGAGLLGGAGITGLFAVEFLLLALMFGMIAWGLSPWVAALGVAMILAVIAAILALGGKKSVSEASLAPTRTLHQVKSDFEAIKSDIERVRSKV